LIPHLRHPFLVLRAWILYRGLGSGLISGLLYTTLTLWLADRGVPLLTCAQINLLSLPYAFKVFFAPLVGRSFLGTSVRLSGQIWLCASHGLLSAALLGLSFIDPRRQLVGVMAVYGLVAVAGMVHDCICEGVRAREGTWDQQGALAAHSSFGYRLGVWAAGLGPAVLAVRFGLGWPWVWRALALFWAVDAGLGLVWVFWTSLKRGRQRPLRGLQSGCSIQQNLPCGQRGQQQSQQRGQGQSQQQSQQQSYWKSLVQGFVFLGQTHRLVWVLITLFCGRLSDVAVRALIPFFLISHGWTSDSIATTDKGLGLAATLLGIFVCARSLKRFRRLEGLFFNWHVCQAVVSLGFGLYAFLGNCSAGRGLFHGAQTIGKSHMAIMVGLAAINGVSGFGTAAGQAYLGLLCHRAPYGQTEAPYGLLTAFGAVSRIVVSTAILAIASHSTSWFSAARSLDNKACFWRHALCGLRQGEDSCWPLMFFLCALACLPGALMAKSSRRLGLNRQP
jgi:MFS transporter, PAT family, beta-lactamase induction signal transducer AmpG